MSDDHSPKDVADHQEAVAALAEAAAVASGPRDPANYVDPTTLGLTPCKPVDLSSCGTFSELLFAMRDTAFGGRQLGEAADVLEEMVRDPDCFVVGTFSGAMTVAKQGLVLCDMIDNGMLNAVVSTGALMAHGLVEASGMSHFKHTPDLDDRELFYAGFDRVYDTLELEQNLDDLEVIVDHILGAWPQDEIACSRTICDALGRYLIGQRDAPSESKSAGNARKSEARGILMSAVERNVPVYVPAFSDSELGLDFALHNRQRKLKGRSLVAFDPFLDLDHYADRILETKRLGIFTIGGGVPRNWAQQVAPYTDLMRSRHGWDVKPRRFQYGVRLCPEPVHWGGLSGCTYSEGVSWGKFTPIKDGGRFAEVPADATIAWPMLVAGVLERLRNDPTTSFPTQ